MNIQYVIQIILSILSIGILMSVYKYLGGLKECSCFVSNQHPEYKINIEYLQFYQILEIMTLFIFVVLLLLYKNKIHYGGNNGMKFFIFITTFLLLGLTGYMSYNSMHMYFLSKKDCTCVNQWQKYIVYIQGVFNSIYFLRLLFTISLVFLMITFNLK